jgi:hypothetical protein
MAAKQEAIAAIAVAMEVTVVFVVGTRTKEDMMALVMAMVAVANKGHLQTSNGSFVTRMATPCIGVERDLITISRVKRSLLMRRQPHHRMG